MSAQTESAGSSTGGSQRAREQRPDGGGRPLHPDPPPAEAIKQAMNQVAALREFVSYYVAVKIDSLMVTLRNLGIYAAMGVIGLIAAAAMVVTAVVLLLTGIAGAFGQLFSGHPWLGNIITAVLVLGLIAGSVVFVMKKLTNTFRSQTVKKYEDRLSHERQQFGRNVRDEALADKPLKH